jgi:heptosyltransferase-2
MLQMIDNILICGTNWLGDSIMSMPAIQLLKQRQPSSKITMLVKPKLAALWKMHQAVDEMIPLEDGFAGALRGVSDVKKAGVSRAFIFPNSFRSALLPFLAGVRERVGMRGHQRSWMLTRTVAPPSTPDRNHQSWEYIEIAGESAERGASELPRLVIPWEVRTEVGKKFGIDTAGELIGLIPGAARGPSKRWPPERFVEVGYKVSERAKCHTLVFGSDSERELCAEVANGIGRWAHNLAGNTTLSELAALLGLCRVVICNDSGGMHLASAVGTKVVAIFGLTDPATTGPMGKGHRVICAEGVSKSRDIARTSSDAAGALRTIGAARVAQAALDVM